MKEKCYDLIRSVGILLIIIWHFNTVCCENGFKLPFLFFLPIRGIANKKIQRKFQYITVYKKTFIKDIYSTLDFLCYSIYC